MNDLSKMYQVYVNKELQVLVILYLRKLDTF